MSRSGIAADELVSRLEATASAQFDAADWAVETDSAGSATVRLPDRRLVVYRRDGPEGTTHWTLELAADGKTVSKFGPFEAIDDVLEQIRSLLDSDVRYTVCCDG